jgi:hypothetical protein
MSIENSENGTEKCAAPHQNFASPAERENLREMAGEKGP